MRYRKDIQAVVNHIHRKRVHHKHLGGFMMVGADGIELEITYRNKAIDLFKTLGVKYAVILYTNKKNASPEIRTFDTYEKASDYYDFAQTSRKDIAYISLFDGYMIDVARSGRKTLGSENVDLHPKALKHPKNESDNSFNSDVASGVPAATLVQKYGNISTELANGEPINENYFVANIDVPGPETFINSQIDSGPSRPSPNPNATFTPILPDMNTTSMTNTNGLTPFVKKKGVGGFGILAVGAVSTLAITAIKHKHRG